MKGKYFKNAHLKSAIQRITIEHFIRAHS